MPEKVYCHGEPGEFPEDQFFVSDEGIMIHKVGPRKNWHYLNGAPVHLPSIPGTRVPDTIPGPLAPSSTIIEQKSPSSSSRGRKV